MRISDWSSDVCSSDLAEVAPEREFEPAGDRVALDRGDHRLFEQHPRRAHRPGAAGVVAAGADRAEIETRAEMARTSGPDGDARVPVFRGSREGFPKRESGEGIHRIALCGAVDCHASYTALLRNNAAHQRPAMRRVGERGVVT